MYVQVCICMYMCVMYVYLHFQELINVYLIPPLPPPPSHLDTQACSSGSRRHTKKNFSKEEFSPKLFK